MKIIYVNCGVKNYLKEDHRSCIRNLCSCEKKAWKNNIYIYIYSNNSSLRNSHIYIYDFQVSIYNFIIILSRVHHEPIQRPAPSWLVSLIGRALHRYRRGQGFESRTSLNFFQAFFSPFLFCPYLGVSNTHIWAVTSRSCIYSLWFETGWSSVWLLVVDYMWIAFVELLLRT